MAQERDFPLDVIKTIGILGIILAHTDNLPILVKEIRVFDVPLMLFASGLAFRSSLRAKNFQIPAPLQYIKKRLIRLLLPTWIFLGFFFSSAYFFNLLFPEQAKLFPVKAIIDTFLLDWGIGFVWVIRVFCAVSAIAPLLLYLYQKIGLKYFGLFLICSYIVFEFLYAYYGQLSFPTTGNYRVNWFINSANRLSFYYFYRRILFFAIPYGCFFGLGMIAPDLKKKHILGILGVALLAWTTCIAIGAPHFVQMQVFKYPPRLYFNAYGVMGCLLIYLFSDRLAGWLKQINLQQTIYFLSASSLWLYLWHVAVLEHPFFLWLRPFGPLNFFGEFVYLVVVSAILVAIQQVIVSKLLEHLESKKKLCKFLKAALL